MEITCKLSVSKCYNILNVGDQACSLNLSVTALWLMLGTA